MGSRIAPGQMVACCILRVLLYGDGSGVVVFRRPALQIVVVGVEDDGVVVLPAVERKEGVEAVPADPGWGGGRSWLSLPGSCPLCRPMCLQREGRPLGSTRCRPLSSASTPGGWRGSLGVLRGRIGIIARRP